MLETWVPPVVALAYVVLLFLVAYFGDRMHQRGRYVPTPVVYSLALGIYCTSWTFFGAVGGRRPRAGITWPSTSGRSSCSC
jgi:Na+/proline symporter